MTESTGAKQINIKKNKFRIPSLMVLIGSLMLVTALFVPFAAGTKEYKEKLNELPNEIYLEEIGMANKDLSDLSLFEYGKIYYAASKNEVLKGAGSIYLVLFGTFAVGIALTTLFSILKKPIAVMIFNIFSLVVFNFIRYDFTDRGVIPSMDYNWGIAQYIYYVGAVIVILGAITLFIAKIKAKKERKALSQMN